MRYGLPEKACGFTKKKKDYGVFRGKIKRSKEKWGKMVPETGETHLQMTAVCQWPEETTGLRAHGSRYQHMEELAWNGLCARNWGHCGP